MKRAIAALCVAGALCWVAPALAGATVLRHGAAVPNDTVTVSIWPSLVLSPPPGTYYPPILVPRLPPR
jgi:hypothetical protein